MGLPESDTTKHRQSSSCTWVPSLGGEDALEKGIATVLQYSCLGNPMDRGAWQATVQRVAEESTTT